ncbi:MAG: TlpA family protein disulfide reductase [Bacteroidia bacterium]|nr:TlpA family protein disulfide reductase [Bacteroidia bacterium]
MVKLKNIFLFFIAIFLSLLVNAQIKFGYYAPEIALPGVSGDTIRLSSLKGKVVLLDFWASWCAPCRISNKHMVKLYPKYKEKGFEILGISLDDNMKGWLKAVKKDKISWLQVIDRGGWEAQTAIKWKIESIPTSYLIDKEGRLIDMDLEPKDLEKKLKELLGN